MTCYRITNAQKTENAQMTASNKKMQAKVDDTRPISIHRTFTDMKFGKK